MKTAKSVVLKKLMRRILGEKITSPLLREYRDMFRAYMSLRRFLREVRDVVAIRCYYTYLKTFRTSHKYPINVRAKPHILFVSAKWCGSDPAMGPTNSEHNLFGSLEASGLATHDRFHFDEYYRQHGHPGDCALLRLCLDSRPDILFFEWVGTGFNPTWLTLKLIRNMGIPIVAIWWDEVEEVADSAPFVDLNVVPHTTSLQRARHPEKYLLMWTPQDPRIYYNPKMNRDIDISFVGSMKELPDRLAGIGALKAKGIDVYRSGGQRESSLSIEEYARAYMRSKIALNFGLGGGGTQQAKGRIFEATLCGAMLLDAENPETKMWFEPMVDYVPFANEADLVEKARYYLEHDAEREQIAAKGHQKAKENYTAKLFWRTVLSRILGDSFESAHDLLKT